MFLFLCVFAIPADAADWNQLRSASAEATSYLKSNWNKYTENYHPSYVLDEDPKTAWVEGAEGQGEGESLTIPVSSLETARAVKLKIRNGYQKTEPLFYANSAPKDVTISLLGPGGEAVASFDRTLTQTMGWQELELATDARGLTAVRIAVNSVHPGTAYKDTCISDVLVYADSDVAYNERAEAHKHEAVKGWIAERQATAAYFAGQPPDYPFASTSFDYEHTEPTDTSGYEAQLTELQATLARLKGQTAWYSSAIATPLKAAPDGAWSLERHLQHFNVGGIAFFEADSAEGRYEREGYPDEDWFPVQRWYSNYKLEKNDDGSVARLYFTEREVIEERGTYETQSEIVIEYTNGRVARMFTIGTGEDEMGPERQIGIYNFQHDGDGRITGFDHWMYFEYLEPWEDMPPEAIKRLGLNRYTGQ